MMRSRVAGVLAAAVFFACTSKKPRAGAEEFCSSDKLFCVHAPGRPQEDGSAQSAPGASIALKQYRWGDPNDIFYLVNTLEYSVDASIRPDYENAVEKVVEGMGRRLGAGVVSRKEVDFAGGRAMESVLENPKGFRLAVRGLVRGDKSYVVASGGPAADYDSAEVSRFFDSFSLK